MSLSLITYPNNTHVNLEIGDIHIDGSLYNSAGSKVNTATNNIIAETYGSVSYGTANPQVITLATIGVWVALLNTFFTNIKNPNGGITASLVGQALYTIQVAGTYLISYTTSFTITAGLGAEVATSIFANISGGGPNVIPGSVCVTYQYDAASGNVLYNASGSALVTLGINDIVNEIAFNTDVTSTNIVVQNANVIIQLVG